MWKKATGACWRQPISFGPFFYETQTDPRIQPTTITASIKFKTSGTLLRNLFPNTSYSFYNDDTVALASISVRSFQNVPLLGGNGLHQVLFEIHGVEYNKPDGSFVRGRFLPIMFEDSADAISFGREHFGYPSVFSDIDVDLGCTDYVQANLSWKGVKWGSLWLKDLREKRFSDGQPKTSSAMEEGIFVHKYVPTTSEVFSTSQCDAEYDIFLVDSLSHSETGSSYSQSSGNTVPALDDGRYRTSLNAGFEMLPVEKSKLPTLHHIIDRLRELPVFDIIEATVTHQEGSLHPTRAIRMV